ncbi:unnamed protein product, partial [Prorocentrum cordatum]
SMGIYYLTCLQFLTLAAFGPSTDLAYELHRPAVLSSDGVAGAFWSVSLGLPAFRLSRASPLRHDGLASGAALAAVLARPGGGRRVRFAEVGVWQSLGDVLPRGDLSRQIGARGQGNLSRQIWRRAGFRRGGDLEVTAFCAVSPCRRVDPDRLPSAIRLQTAAPFCRAPCPLRGGSSRATRRRQWEPIRACEIPCGARPDTFCSV